jgi:2'-5' RNA ligase
VPRLFVAVRPPPEILDRLEALPRPAESGVRYTTREQWHITLRFLGDAEVSTALEALDDLESVVAEAVLGPQVSRRGRPSSDGGVVVVPVAGLDGLALDVVDATAAVGRPPEARPFAGHLTVARLRRRGACRVAGAPIAGVFRVDEVQLVVSELAPGGARHRVVGRRALHPAD